jgi:hypothetical protein
VTDREGLRDREHSLHNADNPKARQDLADLGEGAKQAGIDRAHDRSIQT